MRARKKHRRPYWFITLDELDEILWFGVRAIKGARLAVYWLSDEHRFDDSIDIKFGWHPRRVYTAGDIKVAALVRCIPDHVKAKLMASAIQARGAKND